MKYSRYIVGSFMLAIVGLLGGNVLLSAIFIGIAYGFIDLMSEKSGKLKAREHFAKDWDKDLWD